MRAVYHHAANSTCFKLAAPAAAFAARASSAPPRRWVRGCWSGAAAAPSSVAESRTSPVARSVPRLVQSFVQLRWRFAGAHAALAVVRPPRSAVGVSHELLLVSAIMSHPPPARSWLSS